MPGTHPPNAYFGAFWTEADDRPRFGFGFATRRGARTDLLTIRHEDGLATQKKLNAISWRKYAAPARTLARRHEVADRAREAVAVLGWALTPDERQRIEGFATAHRGR